MGSSHCDQIGTTPFPRPRLGGVEGEGGGGARGDPPRGRQQLGGDPLQLGQAEELGVLLESPRMLPQTK